ncbi:beta-ketoacyl-[acyl-carrier-protein] synthase family protein [soil metagenome]
MPAKVYITGTGLVTALGVSKAANLKALIAGQPGIGPIQHLQTLHKGYLPVGEVKYSNMELLALCGLPGDAKQYTRTTLLGLLAAKEAFQQAVGEGEKARTGFISANSVGGMGSTELFFEDFLKDPKSGDILKVATHDCGDSTEDIAKVLGIKDFVTTISTACSSSANSIMLGARMIKMGLLDRVVAGGTDALTKFTLNGFNSLQILDKEPCKPFDENRKGLNLGEGAGYIVLESEALAMKHPQRILGILAGYANTNDAYHQTASSPEGKGAGMAIEKALSVAGLTPSDIDYINAHGTGTENNDLSEGLAIERVFGGKLPLFSSTKAFTGHTLAAAGGVEAVISLLSIEHQKVFANLNFHTQMKELLQPPQTTLREVSINHILSNSFGFGGNCSSLVISKHIAK